MRVSETGLLRPTNELPAVANRSAQQSVQSAPLQLDDAPPRPNLNLKPLAAAPSLPARAVAGGTENQPPKVKLPIEDQLLKLGDAFLLIDPELEDESRDTLKVTYRGTFTPEGSTETVPYEVITNALGGIVFNAMGSLHPPGLYRIEVAATDEHGASASDDVLLKVAKDTFPPEVSFGTTDPLTAPNSDSVHTVYATLKDGDQSPDELAYTTTTRARVADARGRLRERQLEARSELRSDGTLAIHLPIPGATHSETTVSVHVRDRWGQASNASTVVRALPAPQSPRITTPQDPVRLSTSTEVASIPVDVTDPNGDTMDIQVVAQRDGKPIEARVVTDTEPMAVRFTPDQVGKYTFTLTAKETLTGTRSSESTFEVEVGTPASLGLRTPVWAGGPNEWSAKGKAAHVLLPEVPHGATELRGANISVKGATPFVAGFGPDDIHAMPTQTHDAFAQSVTFHALATLRRRYESLGLPTNWEQLVQAKSGKNELRANVNVMKDTNAYYRPDTEELYFGTSGGKWSLATDGDVVVHEGGHFVLDHLAPDLYRDMLTDVGPIHEGYADAQAALLYGDPEVAEDFGRIRGVSGTPMRNVYNQLKISDTRPPSFAVGPHNRGRVFGGMMWSIGEWLHEEIGETRRDRTPDKQPLDREAANTALKILWTFPLYLGTRVPSRIDFVRSLLESVEDLERGGHLPEDLDPRKLKNFIILEAGRRELMTPMDGREDSAGFAQSLAGARSIDEALTRATQGLGFRADAQLQGRLQTPGGQEISRYRLSSDITLAGAEQAVPVLDDHVTVIRDASGSYRLQMGQLPQLRDHISTPQPDRVVLGQASSLSVSQDAVAESMLRKVRARLATRGAQAMTSEAVLNAEQVFLGWRRGVLTAVIQLPGEEMSAPLTPNGGVGPLKTRKTIID